MERQKILRKMAGNIRDIRTRFAVKKLFVFGSAARGTAKKRSDIDILVVFSKKATFDLFMDLKFYLEELLETKVDLVTDKALRPEVKKAIQRELINVA